MTESTTLATLGQTGYTAAHASVVALLRAARHVTACTEITVAYWAGGRRIVEGKRGKKERAAYGYVEELGKVSRAQKSRRVVFCGCEESNK